MGEFVVGPLEAPFCDVGHQELLPGHKIVFKFLEDCDKLSCIEDYPHRSHNNRELWLCEPQLWVCLDEESLLQFFMFSCTDFLLKFSREVQRVRNSAFCHADSSEFIKPIIGEFTSIDVGWFWSALHSNWTFDMYIIWWRLISKKRSSSRSVPATTFPSTPTLSTRSPGTSTAASGRALAN